MIKETHIKEVDKDNGTIIISFEGDKEDIYRIRNYAEHMHDEPEMCEDKSENIIDDEYDIVNKPAHYAANGMECIYEMVMLYGFEETMAFCKLNCHKYRKRALDKGGRTDIEKSDWYISTYIELAESKKRGIDPLQYVMSHIS